jgi:hypothetical protein
MARIKIAINGNEFEAEGDETFLKGLFDDFKEALASAAPRVPQGSLEQVKQIETGASESSPADKALESDKGQISPIRNRKKKSKSVTADRKLNLRPDGMRSFAEFAAEKIPTGNHEKNVISVYYLTEILGRPSASAAEIVSCYEDRNWRVPADIRNSLQKTASMQGWINTESSDEITVEVKGSNHVKHDMPALKKIES